MQWWHELTPFEYAYLRAFNEIESFGDEREDARVKKMTLEIINHLRWSGDGVDGSDLEYLKTEQVATRARPADSASPNQAAMIWRAAAGGR